MKIPLVIAFSLSFLLAAALATQCQGEACIAAEAVQDGDETGLLQLQVEKDHSENDLGAYEHKIRKKQKEHKEAQHSKIDGVHDDSTSQTIVMKAEHKDQPNSADLETKHKSMQRYR
jgi:hypothetical protein